MRHLHKAIEEREKKRHRQKGNKRRRKVNKMRDSAGFATAVLKTYLTKENKDVQQKWEMGVFLLVTLEGQELRRPLNRNLKQKH